MFVPMTETERQSFLNQTSGSFIPGYTGHCPTLKFQFGRCYGTDTKDIIKKLREENVIKDTKVEYRSDDPTKPLVLTPIKKSQDQAADHAEEIMRKESHCILGYTGYVPGLNFRYGKSYGRAAEESMHEFFLRQKRLEENIQHLRAAHNPTMLSTIRNRDDVSKALLDYTDKIKYKDKFISPECPPIAGYTGHIPRVKGNELSLSKRYNTVAQQGLALLRQSQETTNHLNDIDQQIQHLIHDQNRIYGI